MDPATRRRSLAGTLIGNYELGDVLGEGSMAIVYRARHAVLGRGAAVKILDPEQTVGDAVERCFREARAVSDISHPNVVELLDCGITLVDGGTLPLHYLIFELLEGRTLRALLKAEKLPLARALAIASRIGQALAAAHEAGVVHRDVKPENVFVGEGDEVKVLDFGLAKLTSASASKGPRLSASGVALGTPMYMAPEQVDARPDVDARADVYGLGMVLYELVTGVAPFADERVSTRMWRRMHQLPGAPSELAPEAPAGLDELILAMLDPDPARRVDLATVLPLLEDPEQLAVYQAPPTTRVAQRARTEPVVHRPRGLQLMGLIGLGLLAVIAGAALVLYVVVD